jgi:hypothetical protein
MRGVSEVGRGKRAGAIPRYPAGWNSDMIATTSSASSAGARPDPAPPRGGGRAGGSAGPRRSPRWRHRHAGRPGVPCAAAPARDQLPALAAAEPLPAAERVPSRASLSRSAQCRSAQFRRPARGPLARGTATADGSWRFRRCVRRRGSASPRLPEPASRRPLVALARHCEVGVHPRSVAAPARRDAPSCGASAARRFASIWSRCGGGAYVQAQPDPPPAGSVLRLCRASPVCPVGNSRGSIVRPQRRNELPNPLPTAITSRSEAACEAKRKPRISGAFPECRRRDSNPRHADYDRGQAG